MADVTCAFVSGEVSHRYLAPKRGNSLTDKPSEMEFKAIKRSSAPELVVEQILKSIESGALAPGGQLPSQKELSVRFGVSRASVREATKALNAMGYLDIIQGKGTFVRAAVASRNPSINQLHEALEAVSFFDLMNSREILECTAAELAAEMADNAQITSTGTYNDAVVTSRRILAHLVNSDGKKAFESMRQHLKLVTDVLKQLIIDGRVDPIRMTASGRNQSNGSQAD